MTAYNLYWIHHPEHTDMFTQGYVGISKNIKARWYRHKAFTQNAHLKNAIAKYGWDTLVKKIVLIADEAYCLMIEAKLRAKKNIGWNIIEGGGKPPLRYGNQDRLGLPSWNKGISWSEETRKRNSEAHLGQVPWNKGLTTPDDVKQKLSLAKIGKPGHRKGTKHTPEAIAKMKARPRPVFTEATRAAISLANKGRKHETVTCPHCDKTGGITAMSRWHFDNCKGK